MNLKNKIWIQSLWIVVVATTSGAQDLPPPPPPPPPPSMQPAPSTMQPAPLSTPKTDSSLPSSIEKSLPAAKGFSNKKATPGSISPNPNFKSGVGTSPVPPSNNSGGVRMEPDSKGMLNLDFVNVDIGDMVKSISELTKRNFILDDKVHGKITIISPKPVTVEEAYQAFISALSVQNFTVIPAGKMLKILPLRDMKNNPIPTDIEPLGGDDAFVTRLVPVQYISATELVKSLRGFLTKNGDVIDYPPTNTLIITDAVGNLRRLIKIIEKLDRQGNQEKMEVIRIKFAPCTEVAEKVSQIMDLKGARNAIPTPGGDSGQPTGQLVSKLLPDDRTNSLIVVASQEGLRRVKEIVDTIDQALEKDANRGTIHVHYLQYADATELLATLSSLTGKGGNAGYKKGGNVMNTAYPTPQNRTMFPTAGGMTPPPMGSMPGATNASLEGTEMFDGKVQITADVPTNSLVITASPGDYKSMIPVIQKLDIRRPQAFIEAMIMEVDIDKALDVGAAAHLGGQTSDGQVTAFGASEFAKVNSLSLPTDISNLAGFTLGLQGRNIKIPVAGGKSINIPVYGAQFRALQSNGTVNVLSTPNILTSDNKEAEIVVGQVVPFITAQGRDINNQPINQIQRESVAITLRVTPQINESDDITMNIFQQIQDLVANAQTDALGPTTSNRSAKTTVLVKDSQTVTIGGLIADRDQLTESKVPVLGDIPLVGWFFKSKTKSKRKTSLVIYITPHIIRTPEDLMEASIQRNMERVRFLESNNMKDNTGIKAYGMDRSFSVPERTSSPSKNEEEAGVSQ